VSPEAAPDRSYSFSEARTFPSSARRARPTEPGRPAVDPEAAASEATATTSGTEDRRAPVAAATVGAAGGVGALGAAGAESAADPDTGTGSTGEEPTGSDGAAGADDGGAPPPEGPDDDRPDGDGPDDDGHDPEGSDTQGSLPKVALWTVLTTVLPGAGLITTHRRRFGVILLAVLGLAVVVVAAFLVIGDPLRTGMMLLTHRSVLIAITAMIGLVGLVWALQIVLANLAHTKLQRLEGAKRYLALALAALMVVAVAMPFGRGFQSLWAAQGLLGSESVFAGGDGREHPFVEGKDPWANTERVNILLLGQDSGVDRTGTRPDTIMMASIDTATGQTALFSIPRNLEKVRFPEGTPAAEAFPDGFDYFGKNQDLINAVWTWAEDHPDLFPGDSNPGLTATTWAVEETLGLESDYYAMVNLQGFEDLVNAIGGVDLVVERRIPIGGGVNQATGGKYPVTGHIEAGQQKLDGFHALWYARSREGSNDFDRMCRQQRMVRAVTEESDPTTLAMSIPGLVTATEENIQTDIPVANLNAFVDLALRVKDGGFTSYPITQDVTPSGNPDWDYLKEWTAASIEDSMKDDSPDSVLGETEPGSNEPADTGAPPPAEGEEDPTESATEDTPTTDDAETTEESEEDTTAPEKSKAPEIDQDPLKSCLPGAEQG